MSQNQILIKRANTAGTIPSPPDLSIGELCINTNDGILYAKKSVSGVESVISFLDASKLVKTTDTAARATSIANGAGGNVLYQSAAGTTGFVANGTTGQFLQSNGASAPTWATIDLSSRVAKSGDTMTGNLSISAGGLSVAGGVTIATGGLTVSASGANIAGGVTVNGGAVINQGGLSVNGLAQVNGSIVTNGDVTAFGSVGSFSDARLKDNVKQIESAVDQLSKIQGVTFTWKDHQFLGATAGTNDYGVIAQEVKKVFPEMVKPFDIGVECYDTVAYTKLVPVLIEAIKELAAEVAELKASAKKASKSKE